MDEKHHQALIQIGLNILYHRKSRGLTQEQLVELLGYSKNHIQQVETACAVPSVALLLDIAGALDIPPSRVFEFK